MVAVLRFLIWISVVLFAIGLVIFFSYHYVLISRDHCHLGAGVLCYAITIAISVSLTTSPFYSPLSRVLGQMYRHVHAWFWQCLIFFNRSSNMDTTPVTPSGHLGRGIQIFHQKTHPCWRQNSKRLLLQRGWMSSSILLLPRPCRASFIVRQTFNTVD